MGNYFKVLFSNTDEVIGAIVHQLNHPKLKEVDMIVGIGLSGTMPLLFLKEKSGIDIFAFRKDNVASHGGHSSGSRRTSKCVYVIIDDFVETGKTLIKLRSRINESYPRLEMCRCNTIRTF